MRRPHRLPLSAMALALALAIALPSAAGARSERDGERGRGRSSEARREDSSRRAAPRGGSDRSGTRIERRDRGPRAEVRSGARVERRDRGPRADDRSGARIERRDRGPRAEVRSDARWRDSGRRVQPPSYRASTRYRHDGPSYRQRSYYTGAFYRPRFHYHRGFSLGVFISVVPSYGYRYYDPYCDMTLGDLDYYDDHCDEYRHPDAIQVLELRTGYPIATCAFRDGYWVVDDCY